MKQEDHNQPDNDSFYTQVEKLRLDFIHLLEFKDVLYRSNLYVMIITAYALISMKISSRR